jgi:hypothetical protein
VLDDVSRVSQLQRILHVMKFHAWAIREKFPLIKMRRCSNADGSNNVFRDLVVFYCLFLRKGNRIRLDADGSTCN